HRIALEAVDEKPRGFVERWVERTAHVGAAALSRPRFDGRKQDLGSRAIGGLKKAEHRDIVVVRLVMPAIVDRCNPPDHLSVAPGEEQIDLGMRKKWIVL